MPAAAAPTPNLDRLAAEGIILDNCCTPCSVCIPARCSLLSGLYPHNQGVFGYLATYYIPPAITRIFQDIRAVGYTTAQVGKHHWTEGRLLPAPDITLENPIPGGLAMWEPCATWKSKADACRWSRIWTQTKSAEVSSRPARSPDC